MQKNTKNKNPKVEKIKKGEIRCAVCDCKKLRFVKQQEAKGLLSMTCEILLMGSLL